MQKFHHKSVWEKCPISRSFAPSPPPNRPPGIHYSIEPKKYSFFKCLLMLWKGCVHASPGPVIYLHITYGWKHCGDCPTCERGIQINFRTRGCVYEIKCLDCHLSVSKQYRGQSGRSLKSLFFYFVWKWISGGLVDLQIGWSPNRLKYYNALIQYSSGNW